jgi:hypothetical protein
MSINRRLQHDTAFALATALLDIVRNCIREETEAHDIRRQRIETRLRPFNN